MKFLEDILFFSKGQTFTDVSPGFGEDSAFGTLASTDSYNTEQKPRSDSVQSGHLDVFSLDHSPKVIISDLSSQVLFVKGFYRPHPIYSA